MSKICPECKIAEKYVSPKGRKEGYCLPCKRLKHRVYLKIRRAQIKAYIDSVKANPCTDCGDQYPVYIMQFDHCRGKKRKNIHEFWASAHSMQTLQIELAKCDLVCANCHAERTWSRLQVES